MSAESYIDYQGGTTSTDSNCDYFVADTSSTMTASVSKVGEWVVKYLFYYFLDQFAEQVLGELANPVTGFTFGDPLPPFYQHRAAAESCPGPGGSVEPAICDEGVVTNPIFTLLIGDLYLERKYWAWKIGSAGWGCHQTSTDSAEITSSQVTCTDGT